MFQYIVRRLLSTVPVLFGISLMLFLIVAPLMLFPLLSSVLLTLLVSSMIFSMESKLVSLSADIILYFKFKFR